MPLLSSAANISASWGTLYQILFYVFLYLQGDCCFDAPSELSSRYFGQLATVDLNWFYYICNVYVSLLASFELSSRYFGQLATSLLTLSFIIILQGEYELVLHPEEGEDKKFSPKKNSSWEIIDLEKTDKVLYFLSFYTCTVPYRYSIYCTDCLGTTCTYP